MTGILQLIAQQLLGKPNGLSSTQTAPTYGTPPYAPGPSYGQGGEVPPIASNASAPSHTTSTGGTTGAPVGGAQDGPVAPQPEGRKHGGILGALGSVFSPEPGSWWYSALNNPNGIWGAKGAQQAYQQDQVAKNLATQKAQLDLERARTKGEYQVVGNNVFHIKPDGTTEMIGAPAQPSETERLIDRWRNTPAGAERDLLERAIRGYQYTPEVINAQGAARTATAVAGANARGAQARLTKKTPGASSGRGGGSSAKLPTGFILNP